MSGAMMMMMMMMVVMGISSGGCSGPAVDECAERGSVCNLMRNANTNGQPATGEKVGLNKQ